MGEDCTSSFKLKGNELRPRFHECFQQLGDDWNGNADVLKEVEKFMCPMYGQSREMSADGARVKLLCKMAGEDEKLTFKSKVDRRSPSPVLLCSKATYSACKSLRCVVQMGTSSNRGETKSTMMRKARYG